MDAIEELLETQAIRKVRIQYSHFYDGQQLEPLVDLFTDDAVCEFGADFGGDWVGKDQIREKFTWYLEHEGPVHGVMHSTTNHLIDIIDEETANGRCYLLDLRTTEGVENPLILFGIYDDLYKKVDDRWRIHRTRIDFLWPKRNYVGPREIQA